MSESTSPNTANMDNQQAMTALKRHGGNILTVIAAVLAIYFGWKFWQQRPQPVDTIASDKFSQLQTLQKNIALNQLNPTLSDDAKQALQTDKEKLATESHNLATEHSSSIYAWQALILQAREQMNNNDYESASETLKSALNIESIDAGLSAMTSIRYARALLASGKIDEALSAISIEIPESFEASKQELLGDIYRAKDDNKSSIRAYQNAWDALTKRDEHRAVLALKMESMGMVVEPIAMPTVVEEINPTPADIPSMNMAHDATSDSHKGSDTEVDNK